MKKKRVKEIVINDNHNLLKKDVITAPKNKRENIIASLMLVFIMLSGILGYIWITTFDWSPVKVLNEKNNYPVNIPIVTIVNEKSNSRPIAIMINNHPDARVNHAGLQDAYMVYEIIVEGGLTRYMALFKDVQTARIGSVRSSRHYFLDYAMENDAIYTHFGWSPYAESDIYKYGINNINGMVDGDAFWRDYSLNVDLEHTAFTSIDKILSAATNRGYRLTTDQSVVLNYTPYNNKINTMDGAKVANKVVIPYSYWIETSYTYDAVNQVYNRFVNGVVHKDAITGKQYTAKNILVYQVGNSTIAGDPKGRQTLDNLGTGTGWYITNGYAIPMTWQKDSRESKTIYRYQNGEEIKFNNGNTWVQIEPLYQDLQITE
jgi:hypothetical protein